MKISVCFAFLLILCSCSANRSINDDNNINVTVSSLGGKCFIGLPIQLLSVGDFLLINDFHEPFVKIIDKNSGETVNNICRKGNGPNEFFAPLQLIAENGRLYIMYRQKYTLFSMPIDSLSSPNPNFVTEAKFPDASKIHITDNFFLTSGTFETNRYRLYDRQGELKKHLFELPSYWSDESGIDNESKAMFHQSMFSDNTSTGMFASATSATLSIYQANKEEIECVNEILLHDYKYDYIHNTGLLRADLRQDFTIGVKKIASNDKFIFLLYNPNKQGQTESSEINRILVYNWEGEYVATLIPDIDLTTFTVDQDNTLIYAITNEDEPKVVTIDLASTSL